MHEPKVAEVTDVTLTQLGEVTGHWEKGIITRVCFSIVQNQKWVTEMNPALLAVSKRCASDVGDRKGSLTPRSFLGVFHLSGRTLLHQAVLTTLFWLLPSTRKTPTFPGIHSGTYATQSYF